MATLVEVAQACMQCSKRCTGTTCITHNIQRGCQLLYGSSTCAVCPWGQMTYIMADTAMGVYLYWLRTCVTAGVPLAHTDNAVTAAAAPTKQASKECHWPCVDFMRTP
jgi:hypothetical protein